MHQSLGAGAETEGDNRERKSPSCNLLLQLQHFNYWESKVVLPGPARVDMVKGFLLWRFFSGHGKQGCPVRKAGESLLRSIAWFLHKAKGFLWGDGGSQGTSATGKTFILKDRRAAA